MDSTSGKTILLCDDDAGITAVTSIVLDDLGCKVFTVDSGQNVVPAVHKYKPDLVLLDLGLPIKSGEEILNELKKDPDTHDVPVIVVSASKDTAQVATRAKADAFLCKPFDIEALEQIIKEHVSGGKNEEIVN